MPTSATCSRSRSCPTSRSSSRARRARRAEPYPYKNIHKYLQQIIETFGPERCFWGTDITRMPISYRQCVTMFTEEMPWLKGRDLEKVMGGAVVDWLGWKRPASSCHREEPRSRRRGDPVIARKRSSEPDTERRPECPPSRTATRRSTTKSTAKAFPYFTFAPAGLRSTIAVWSQPSAPINPITEWSGSYRVIVMDQRNAGGQSRAPINAKDNWDTYTSDHIAVLDHLKIDKCHLFGQCIGGSFIANLIKKQPQRVASAVWAQPIGRVGPMKPGYTANFEAWTKTLGDHPEATDAVLDAFYHNLYDPGFLYAADREFVKNCKTPSLAARGQRRERIRVPSPTSSRSCMPNVRSTSPSGRTARPLETAKGRMKQFLAKNTPAGAS